MVDLQGCVNFYIAKWLLYVDIFSVSFSIIVYYSVNTVPCAIQGLVVHPACSDSLHPLTPDPHSTLLWVPPLPTGLFSVPVSQLTFTDNTFLAVVF